MEKILCKWCGKQLNSRQEYEFRRGKTKGSCSASCGGLIYRYGNKKNYKKIRTRVCEVCKKLFDVSLHKKNRLCSSKCAGRISSERMKNNNPMNCAETRKKVSETLKRIKHSPKKRGGNGRKATVPQKLLFDSLSIIDKSFRLEFIELTGAFLRYIYKAPYHYKIDIASNKFMIAIEVDGVSHQNSKARDRDSRKDNLLKERGWSVVRFKNKEVMDNLNECVNTVKEMIIYEK